MTGAEIDTRRRALGLSVAETAKVCGVSERSVSYWLNGGGEPRDPEDVSARLREVEDIMGDLVEAIAEGVSDTAERAHVTLPRYRTQAALDASGDGRGLPLGAHAMMIAWATDDLRADGHVVSIEWAS